jgi:hypothetical protein
MLVSILLDDKNVFTIDLPQSYETHTFVTSLSANLPSALLALLMHDAPAEPVHAHSTLMLEQIVLQLLNCRQHPSTC